MDDSQIESLSPKQVDEILQSCNLNLTRLSFEEKLSVLKVLHRDDKLVRKESDRVRTLKGEIIQLKRKAASITPDGTVCSRCGEEFGLLFNTGALCPRCQSRVCKTCRETDASTSEEGWLCLLCSKQQKLKACSNEWFYDTFKRRNCSTHSSPTFIRRNRSLSLTSSASYSNMYASNSSNSPRKGNHTAPVIIQKENIMTSQFTNQSTKCPNKLSNGPIVRARSPGRSPPRRSPTNLSPRSPNGQTIRPPSGSRESLLSSDSSTATETPQTARTIPRPKPRAVPAYYVYPSPPFHTLPPHVASVWDPWRPRRPLNPYKHSGLTDNTHSLILHKIELLRRRRDQQETASPDNSEHAATLSSESDPSYPGTDAVNITDDLEVGQAESCSYDATSLKRSMSGCSVQPLVGSDSMTSLTNVPNMRPFVASMPTTPERKAYASTLPTRGFHHIRGAFPPHVHPPPRRGHPMVMVRGPRGPMWVPDWRRPMPRGAAHSSYYPPPYHQDAVYFGARPRGNHVRRSQDNLCNIGDTMEHSQKRVSRTPQKRPPRSTSLPPEERYGERNNDVQFQ